MVQGARRAYVAGIVVNAVAMLAALAAFPYLALPLLELGFVGLVAAPATLLLFIVAFVVIDIGPLVGLVTAFFGRGRVFTWVTGLLSLVSLVGLVVSVALIKTRIDLDNDGRTRGPAPAGCKPKTTDASAVGRPCDPDAGVPPAGNCPPEYFCLERVVDHPETNECMIYCSADCECPRRFKCVYSKCVR